MGLGFILIKNDNYEVENPTLHVYLEAARTSLGTILAGPGQTDRH